MKIAYWAQEIRGGTFLYWSLKVYDSSGTYTCSVVPNYNGKFDAYSFEIGVYHLGIFEFINEAKHKCEDTARSAGYRVLTESEANLL